MGTRFTRRPEDFTCEHCGAKVTGDGYTNHCPACLWSKHVDVNPGDRNASCGGMMEPIRVELHNGDWRIIHRCLTCHQEKPNRVSPHDNQEVAERIAREAAELVAGGAKAVLES